MSGKIEHYNKAELTPGTIEYADSKNKSQYSIQTGESLMGSLPNNYYLDIGSANAYKAIISHGIIKSAGANTSTNTNKLIDSGATFESDVVKIGHTVLNLTDNSEAKVVSIDSEIQLTLDADIFQSSSKTYKVGPDVFQLPQAYVTGQAFYIAIANDNTGASTLNINSIGAIDIRHPGGAVINSGGLQAGRFYKFIYDGTYFIVEYGRTSQVLQYEIIGIGDWDMNQIEFKSVSHDISHDLIRSVSVIIRNDNATINRDLLSHRGNGQTDDGADGGIERIVSTYIKLVRKTGGSFDAESWSSTGFNRGWVTIWYIG